MDLCVWFTVSRFDVIILSDLLFNHQFHDELIKSCVDCLTEDGEVQRL